MLNPEVIVDLLSKLGVGADLLRHRYRSSEGLNVPRNISSKASTE